MADASQRALGDVAARQLANTTKTPPQLTAITPRWLVQLLGWVPVESGTYRVNKVKNDGAIEVACGSRDERTLPQTFVNYEETPREYTLSAISTVVDVHTRVSDLFSHPHDQIREQLRLTVEKVKERQESELINNADYGLLNNVDPAFKISVRKAGPTPDDLDELLALIWKEPAFFLAHPRAIAAFGRECTRRGVPPPTATIFGSPFLTWRGIPLIPTDKLKVDAAGKTSMMLLRTGERKQGVVGLFQPGLPGEQTPGLSVRFMGIDRNSMASYLVSLYCSAAILAEDALGVLENVEVGQYHEYK
jgi:Type 2A encapsulin shell protein SrpI-like